jgi:hypothetical protein
MGLGTGGVWGRGGRGGRDGRESGWREGMARTAEYFRGRGGQMDAPAFRQAGYPIGGGRWRAGARGSVGDVKVGDSAGDPKDGGPF